MHEALGFFPSIYRERDIGDMSSRKGYIVSK
jgi:hypothetical protein